MPKPVLALLVIILPLTRGLRSLERGERIPDYGRLASEGATSLTNQGWSARPVKQHLIGWVIVGTRRDCRVLIHFMPPEGVSKDEFIFLSRPFGPVSYEYGDRTSNDFPRFIPMLADHFQRYAWSFGISYPTAPLIGIARSRACPSNEPSLGQLREHLVTVYRPSDAKT